MNVADAAMISEWLSSSGIQDRSGGFYSWYDPVNKKYGYLYPEITGYAITALIFLSKLMNRKELIQQAERAAGWIMNEAADPCGGIKTRKYDGPSGDDAYSFDKRWIYTFDCGMALCGLVNLWEATGRDIYLKSAKGIADFLLGKMQRRDGSFFAYYLPSEDAVFDETGKWSTQSGSYHCKLSIGLIKLANSTGGRRYGEGAELTCLNALQNYREGRFITNRADNSTHLHPHFYSVEGLLYAGHKFGRKDFLGYARDATRWAFELQAKDGGIPFIYYPGNPPSISQRVDILAQALRAGVLCRGLGLLNNGYEEKFKRLASRIRQFQNAEKGPQEGAFRFGEDFDGTSKPHLNLWCTVFSIQALALHDRSRAVPVETGLDLII